MRLSPRFEAALVMATQLHAGQMRKGTEEQKRNGTEIPYVSHLLGVSSLVLEHGGSEDQAIAALLHDAVEDQGGEKTLKLIKKVPNDFTIVGESGIKKFQDIRLYNDAGVYNFLIGESILTSKNIQKKFDELLNK